MENNKGKLTMEKIVSTKKEEGVKVIEKKMYEASINISSTIETDLNTNRILSTRKQVESKVKNCINDLDIKKKYTYKDGKLIGMDEDSNFIDGTNYLSHLKATEEEFTASRVDMTDGNKNILSSSIIFDGNEITLDQTEKGELESLILNVNIGGRNVRLIVNGHRKDKDGLSIARLYVDDDESVFNEDYRKTCEHEMIAGENRIVKETNYKTNGYNMVERNSFNYKYRVKDDKVSSIEKCNEVDDKPVSITEILYPEEGTVIYRQYDPSEENK